MNRCRCLAVVILAALALAAMMLVLPPRAVAADEPKPVRTMTSLVAWCGSYSAIKADRIVRITTPEQWAALWAEHCGEKIERDSYSEPVVPQIDFTQWMIVATFRGQSTNIRSEHLEAVDEFADHLRVRFVDRTYQTASMLPKETIRKPGESVEQAVQRGIDEFLKNPDPGEGGANHTTPYGIFVLPRSTKPLIIEQARLSMQGIQGWDERTRIEAAK